MVKVTGHIGKVGAVTLLAFLFMGLLIVPVYAADTSSVETWSDKLGPAQEYLDQQQYSEAEAGCNDLLSQDISTAEKMEVQKFLAVVYIKAGQMSNAQSILIIT